MDMDTACLGPRRWSGAGPRAWLCESRFDEASCRGALCSEVATTIIVVIIAYHNRGRFRIGSLGIASHMSKKGTLSATELLEAIESKPSCFTAFVRDRITRQWSNMGLHLETIYNRVTAVGITQETADAGLSIIARIRATPVSDHDNLGKPST